MRGKIAQSLKLSGGFMLLISCAVTHAEVGKTEKHYDFDHEVHYHQTQIDDNNYRLEIQSDSYQHFQNQSVFLLRHAQRLCKGNSYMLKVTEGVQEYERLPSKPRPYQPPLTVLLQCETEPNKD